MKPLWFILLDQTMQLAQQKAEETKRSLQAMTATSVEERKAAFKNAKAQLSLSRSNPTKET